MGRVWVVLPAYNEEENLPGLLGHLAALGWESLQVLVVDDGSADRTREVVSDSPGIAVHVVSHVRNLGLGRALATGFREVLARASPEDVLVTLDADGSHRPEQIPALVAALREGADLAIASRYRSGALVRGVPPHRRALSLAARALLTVLFPTPGVRDYTCGFRAYRVSLLRAATDRYGERLIESPGFAAAAEILLKLRALRPTAREIPIVLRYDLKRGHSKLPPLRTILQYLRMLVRLAASR